MTTAVDTNVLFDLLSPTSSRSEEARRALDEWSGAGSLVISEAVVAEASVAFATQVEMEEFFRTGGLRLIPSSAEALFLAGSAWKRYLERRPRRLICAACGTQNEVNCASCGNAIRLRQHLIPDFLIGAHAQLHAGRILTRDRGFYRSYFAGLDIVTY